MKNHLCFCVCHSASRQAVPPSPAGKKLKVFAFFRSRRHKIDAQLKNVLRFELHFSFCFGKAEGAEKLRLELLQVVFQEDVPPELLSFVLSFQKRKYMKDAICRFRKEERAGKSTPSVTTSSRRLTPLLGEACKGASHTCKSPPKGEALQEKTFSLFPVPAVAKIPHNIITTHGAHLFSSIFSIRS